MLAEHHHKALQTVCVATQATYPAVDTWFQLETLCFSVWHSLSPVNYEALCLVHSTLSDSETSRPGLSHIVWLCNTFIVKSWNEWTQHITLCPPIRQVASKSKATPLKLVTRLQVVCDPTNTLHNHTSARNACSSDWNRGTTLVIHDVMTHCLDVRLDVSSRCV